MGGSDWEWGGSDWECGGRQIVSVRNSYQCPRLNLKVEEVADIGQVEIPEKEEVQDEESCSGGLADVEKMVGVDRFIHYKGC